MSKSIKYIAAKNLINQIDERLEAEDDPGKIEKLLELRKETEDEIKEEAEKKRKSKAKDKGTPGYFKHINDSGLPRKDSIDNVIVALALFNDMELSYNEFTGEELLDSERIDDNVASILRRRMENDHAFFPQKDILHSGITQSCKENSFHPVRDYIEKCKSEWDGVNRLDHCGSEYFGTEDTPTQNAVARLLLDGMVGRIIYPGIKYDYMVILQSIKQGLGKSLALEVLAGEWYGSGLPLNSNDLSKSIIENTSNAWILECAELGGWRGSDIDNIKAVITRGRDTARQAYARRAVTVERQFIMVGTTNSSAFLKDTENRRFPILEIVNDIDIEKLRRDRDQLIGETAASFSFDKHITLPPMFWEEVEQHSKSFRATSKFEDWFSDRYADGLPEVIIAGELEDEIRDSGIPVHNAEKSRVLSELHGYKRAKKRCSGRGLENKLRSVWVREG